MFVLRKNVDGLTAIIDRLAARCLPRQSHGRTADAAEIRLMRKLTLAFLPALPVVPAAVSLAFGAAIGLPLGFGLVVALYMMTAVALIAGRRVGAESVANLAAAAQSDESGSPYDLCPGLFLGLDAAGLVRTAGGRDRQMFVSFLREPLSRPFVDQVHVSDRLSFIQALDALRQGADAVVIDLRLDRPVLGLDHTQFLNVRMDMTAVRCRDGALTGVQAQILDIEGEMQIRDTVSVKENEAVAAHEAKSRFLAAVSHELRTPLNAILGFSDILAGEYFGKLANDRQREYVQLIRQSGAHLLSVVNTMLDMSKIEAGRYELLLEPFAIAETVTECERMLSLQAASKGVKLTSRLPRGLGEAVADSRALRQVIINLVGNAIKFTDNGGAVIIDANRTATDLVISVSDTGIGMAPEKLSMLGRPFTQVHDDLNRNFEGTGLGLSLVKGLIALHGGTFTISSRPGEGTVVTVTLPVDGSGAVAQAANEDNMVEFPPRLTAQPVSHRRESKEIAYGQANAKIA